MPGNLRTTTRAVMVEDKLNKTKPNEAYKRWDLSEDL
jgi:hypothetical protein